MKALILAGGLGTRLKPFTEAIPKPLLPIGEKAILEIQIDQLKKSGFRDIFIATNYKSDYFEKFLGDGSRFGVRLRISREDKPLGTAGPLRLLQADMKEPFLVINGDILTLANFRGIFDFGLKSQAPLTVVIKKEILPFAFGNVLFSGDFVTDVLEKPDLVLYIVAGIYVATPGVFPLIPPNEYYGMDLLIKSMLSQKIPVAKYELKEYWLDIGRLNDYEKAQSDYREHFRPKNS